jgi:hypothetical protein
MLAEGKNQKLTADQTESLRLILEHGQNRQVLPTEANEVGEALLTLYELLADDSSAGEHLV